MKASAASDDYDYLDTANWTGSYFFARFLALESQGQNER
jgi:hypothetical protein